MSCFGGLKTEFDEVDAQVLGISVDPFPSAGAWAKELKLWFPLLSDWPDHKVSRRYGTFNAERSVSDRVTFVIGKDGVVQNVIDDPADMERHAHDALATLRQLSNG